MRPPITDLQRLTPFGWNGTLLVCLGGMIVSFFLLGFWSPYWRMADQDILLIYDALLQNDNLPREIVFHPAHLIVVLLDVTFRLLHSIGLLNAHSLSTIPPTSDLNAFNHAWTSLVQVGRLLSLSIALLYVAAFGFLLRRLTHDWQAAALGMFAVAFSGGIAMTSRAIKPELLSSALVAIALLMLLIAARSPRLTGRPLLVGAAALVATLAFDNKVQAIFLVAAMPVLLLPFGELSQRGGYWSQRRAIWAVTALAAVALIAAAAAMPLFVEGLIHGAAPDRPVPPLFGVAGAFHVLFAAWIGLGMVAFTLLWRVPVAEALAAAAAIIAGIALGLLPLYIFRETSVVTIVINPIESLSQHIAGPHSECGPMGCGIPFALIFYSLRQMLAYHSFIFQTSPRPEIFLEWFVIGGIIIAYRHGEKKIALQAALLIGTVLGIDTLQAARALKQDYFNFTDPLIIIAAVLLIAKVTALRESRWTFPVGAVLIALHVAFSQAEPVKHALLMRAGPEGNCVFLDSLRRLEPFPFCKR
ncbi:MAG: hypothetical protein ABI830_02335 [Pseudolabrys sp.]